MYIESFDKSSKRTGRGATPKTASFNSVSSRATPTNRLPLATQSKDLTTKSIDFQNKSKLYHLLSGGGSKINDENPILNTTSEAFLASVASQTSQPTRRVRGQSLLLPNSLALHPQQNQQPQEQSPPPSSEVNQYTHMPSIASGNIVGGGGGDLSVMTSVSSTKAAKNNFVIADSLSACKFREKEILSQMYSASTQVDPKKSTRRASASLAGQAAALPSRIPITGKKSAAPPIGISEIRPKTFLLLQEENQTEAAGYYNSTCSHIKKGQCSSRNRKGTNMKVKETNQPLLPLPQNTTVIATANKSKDIRSNSSISHLQSSTEKHMKVHSSTLPTQQQPLNQSQLYQQQQQQQQQQQIQNSFHMQKPNSQLDQYPSSVYFANTPYRSNSNVSLHPQGLQQVESLEQLHGNLQMKSPDQRAAIAATKENVNPIDQIDELKQIFMQEQANISHIISKGMRAIEQKEMNRTSEQNPQTRFSEFRGDDEDNGKLHTHSPSFVSKEDLNKTGLLGAYETYNRMSKHEIIEKLLVSEHIMKQLYKKTKTLQDQLDSSKRY